MRAFAAIEIPETIKDAIASLSRRLQGLGARASWVHRENMHLTLRFFGDLAEEQSIRLGNILADTCREIRPFPICVQGIGVFPNARKPAVIWVGAEAPDGCLIRMNAAAEDAARAIGLPPDDKPFHPHITLARIRDARTAQSLMEAIEHEASFDAGAFESVGMTLFSSELTPKGPVYRVVREFPL